MPTEFKLVISANAADFSADLRLADGDGRHLAHYRTMLPSIPAGRLQGIFDLGSYLRHFVDPGEESVALAEIGTSIAENILGDEIFSTLFASQNQRTLSIQLEAPAPQDGVLATALARVPWEAARRSPQQQTLADRNLIVRVIPSTSSSPESEPLALAPNETLKILFVFAEARGTRPLSSRREQIELRTLFAKEIYLSRNIVAHTLSHGVTRGRLVDKIRRNGGYHIIHWSGHGRSNVIELMKPDGSPDKISGEELLHIILSSGGFLPHLMFLSACGSGDSVRPENWADFLNAVQGIKPTPSKQPSDRSVETTLRHETGHTGIAHALLSGGIPNIVAMRYAVGDEYARDLAVEFYRALLGHEQPKSAASALVLAQRTLRESESSEQNRYTACDLSTPVFYGGIRPSPPPYQGASPERSLRDPRCHQVAELDISSHKHFVGRTWELAGLGAEFIGAPGQTQTKPVAMLIGLGGSGKTALASEIIELWKHQFDNILLYQAKTYPLQLEHILRDIHLRLNENLGVYSNHINKYPGDVIYRDASQDFHGQARIRRLVGNLIRTLKAEPILLVLDNFETNLKTDRRLAEDSSETRWVCQDPEWDDCLKRIAEELGDTHSRVLITSRTPLGTLPGEKSCLVKLGPLTAGEATLFAREHKYLSSMIYSGDDEKRRLVERLLTASRFHPLLMDRLARLAAAGPALETQFHQALSSLEGKQSFQRLTNLFALNPNDAQELSYLDDALVSSNDQLIDNISQTERQVLWTISLASEPIDRDALRAAADGDEETVLRQLTTVGLATEVPPSPHISFTCHEIVKDRIKTYYQNKFNDSFSNQEKSIHLKYAEYFKKISLSTRTTNMSTALNAGRRAIFHFSAAGDFQQLARFATSVAIHIDDRRHANDLIPLLQDAARQAEGNLERGLCLVAIADILDNTGQQRESMPFYEEAAAAIKVEIQKNGKHNSAALFDYAILCTNWSMALVRLGDLTSARQRKMEALEIVKLAGAHEIYSLSYQIDILLFDIQSGRAGAEALSEIKNLTARLENWWSLSQSKRVSLPNDLLPQLFHYLMTAFYSESKAGSILNDWETALSSSEKLISLRKIAQHDMSFDIRNRATILGRLKRYAEAKKAIELCMEIEGTDPGNKIKSLMVLADLLHAQGDVDGAINQANRAFILSESIQDPSMRATIHSNLSAFNLSNNNAAEATPHLLSTFIYAYTADLPLEIQQRLAVNHRRLLLTPHYIFEPPKVADLLDTAAFHALADWCSMVQADATELEVAYAKFHEEVQRAMAANIES